MNWYALYTKPRNEKKVAENLEFIGVEVYCPIISVVKQWSDRKKTTQQPLLNSYVFVRLDEKDRSKVFDVPGVVRYLFWLGKPAIVRDFEINTIKDLLQEKYKEVLVTGIQPGQKIIVEAGAFKGHEAIFKEQKGNKTILVLESLGMTLILER
uniref:UpxY family transcription antiterminator n=1 Tax=Flavobacterium sp. TaxID=239 RepID=UPI00404826D1